MVAFLLTILSIIVRNRKISAIPYFSLCLSHKDNGSYLFPIKTLCACIQSTSDATDHSKSITSAFSSTMKKPRGQILIQ